MATEKPTSRFSVGQTLWFVPSQSYLGSPREVHVSAVGRKWIGLNIGKRIDPQTMLVDSEGGFGRGYCWFKKEDWEESQAIARAWLDISKFVRDRPENPDCGYTLDQLAAIRSALGMPSPTPSKGTK